MDEVREQARSLAHDGVVRLTAGEVVLDPSAPLRGPIRIRFGGADPST